MLRIELTQGAKRNKSKGWHRKELQLNEYYSSENNKKGGKVKGFCPNYNVSEMNQLIYEFDMLSAFLQGSKDNLYCEKKKGDGQFKKRKRKHNPASLTYLMFAWGASFTTVLWVTSREGYGLYAERVIPLLSADQRKKHYDFSKRFQNNWGKGGGKYLLVHYDEKWFWGMIFRRTAKSLMLFLRILHAHTTGAISQRQWG
jgi:hypothetical protein